MRGIIQTQEQNQRKELQLCMMRNKKKAQEVRKNLNKEKNAIMSNE